MYEEKWCSRCVHGVESCPVLHLHMVYNYDQCSDKRLESILEALIPLEGVSNGECRMFVPEVASEGDER